MRVLLTGATGNLGCFVARELVARGMAVVPVVRAEAGLARIPGVQSAVVADLIIGNLEHVAPVDGIVHAAGDLRFTRSGGNAAMMQTVIEYAQHLRIPVCYVSTAYVTEGSLTGHFNNGYEKDKYEAETLLARSGLPHVIVRPSVIVGDIVRGRISRVSGFYGIVRALLSAASQAARSGRTVRFPRPRGVSDLVPVDVIARTIGDLVETNARGVFYATNPEPPRATDVLESVIRHYGLQPHVRVLAPKEIDDEDPTDEEAELYEFLAHYRPYWSQMHIFPESLLPRSFIDEPFLRMILAFADSNLYEPTH